MTNDLLVFCLGLQQFALPIAQVASVVPRATLTPMPGAPPDLIGLLRLRGALCPVIDIRARLGLPGSPPNVGERIVVMHTAALTLGLLAEDIVGVVTAPPRSPADPADVEGSLIRGVVEVDGHVIATLGAEAVIGSEVRAYLAASSGGLRYMSGQAAA